MIQARHESSTTGRSLKLWPLLLVLVGAIAGLTIAVALEDRWQLGCVVVGCSLGLGALIRLVLPTREAGLLHVRSKPFDVATLLLLGAAIIALALVVPTR